MTDNVKMEQDHPAEETGGQRLLQRGDQVLRSAFHQRWRVTYRRSSQSSERVQGTSRRQVTSQLLVYGSVELTVHERRVHGLGTTLAAQKLIPLAADRDRTERLRRDKGAHLDKVHGLLPQRLGNRARRSHLSSSQGC